MILFFPFGFVGGGINSVGGAIVNLISALIMLAVGIWIVLVSAVTLFG
jgi:uncharacterized membrane protein